jgi:hypothetical protein
MDPEISRALFNEQLEEARSSELPHILGWEFLETTYPLLVVRILHPSGETRNFQLNFEAFDRLPPSITLVDSSFKLILDTTQLPEGGPHFFRFHNEMKSRPSLCYDFSAEYYQWWHPGSEEQWQGRRKDPNYRMLGILNRLSTIYAQSNG